MSEKKLADPSALGLFGLAMVTLVASSNKLGFTANTAELIPWALFLGGLGQLIAGIYDYKKCNILGATAFMAYGLFWLAIATNWCISISGFGAELVSPDSLLPSTLAFAYLGYLIFSIFMTIGASETNKILFLIFVFIDFLFLGLTLSSFNINYHFFHTMAGISELTIAILSFYGASANVLNNHFGRVVMPIGKPLGLIKRS